MSAIFDAVVVGGSGGAPWVALAGRAARREGATAAQLMCQLLLSSTKNAFSLILAHQATCSKPPKLCCWTRQKRMKNIHLGFSISVHV